MSLDEMNMKSEKCDITMLCLDPVPHYRRVYQSWRSFAWVCNVHDWLASAILQGRPSAPTFSSIDSLPHPQFHPVHLWDSHEFFPTLSSVSHSLLVALIESNTPLDVTLYLLQSSILHLPRPQTMHCHLHTHKIIGSLRKTLQNIDMNWF